MSVRTTRHAVLGFLAPAAATAAAASLVQASPLPAAAQLGRSPRGPVELLTSPVMDLGYYRYDEVSSALSPGSRLRLCREPRNRYDRRAIAVLTQEGDKLGFVPRACNEALANLMDAGFRLEVGIAKNFPLRKELWIVVKAELNS
ncbi:MAG: HIRAN domain-containing protein [Parvibaculaceae bacterium]